MSRSFSIARQPRLFLLGVGLGWGLALVGLVARLFRLRSGLRVGLGRLRLLGLVAGLGLGLLLGLVGAGFLLLGVLALGLLLARLGGRRLGLFLTLDVGSFLLLDVLGLLLVGLAFLGGLLLALALALFAALLDLFAAARGHVRLGQGDLDDAVVELEGADPDLAGDVVHAAGPQLLVDARVDPDLFALHVLGEVG